MTVVRSSKGLDLPLAGAPAASVEAARPVSTVAVLGSDFPGLRPALKVEVGDRVALGQAIFEDKRHPGVLYTAPAGGTISAIHRGERRALVSVVIAVDESVPQAMLKCFSGRPVSALDGAAVRALLLESGLWTALRTRPFSRVPSPTDQPAAIFVTATDTRPHAVPPAKALAGRESDFETGLAGLAACCADSVCVHRGGHAGRWRRRTRGWSSSPVLIRAATQAGTYIACCRSVCIGACGPSATRTSRRLVAC